MRQLLYVSSKKGGSAINLDTLLLESQANNQRHDVTGLLYTDGHRFLQVLEGPEDAVEATYLRIIADPRHHALVLLSRRDISDREFGDWSMARRMIGESHDQFMEKIARLYENADPSVKGSFAGFIEARRAA